MNSKKHLKKNECIRCGSKGKKFCPKCKIELPSYPIQAIEFKLAERLRDLCK